MAKIFFDSKFSEGGWAPEVAKRLASRRLLPDFRPKGRLWRGTFEQWVQFEPNGWSGPLFWSGTPAIRATKAKLSPLPLDQDGILVGFYVERGLGEHKDPEHVLTDAWHWHRLYQCMSEPALMAELDRLMVSLSESDAH